MIISSRVNVPHAINFSAYTRSARTGAARVWVGASGLDPKAVDEMSYQDMCKAYIDRYLRGVSPSLHHVP